MCQLPGGWYDTGVPLGLDTYTCLTPVQSAAVNGVIFSDGVGVGDGVTPGVGVGDGVGVGVDSGVGVGVADGRMVGVGVERLFWLLSDTSRVG